MIEITNLKKQYDKCVVLDTLDMSVKKGSIYGLIGVNGAGKSTLLNCLSGVFKPDGGSVKIGGEEVYENTAVKGKIAYVTDDPYYFSGSSLLEMAKYLDKMYESFSMEKFEAIAKEFEMDVKGKLSSFSKGMKRQAALTLALAQNAEVLLCDECFDGLDALVRKRVKRILIEEACEREMTVVISSHNLREMENLCDTIGIMSGKKIIIEKSVENMREEIHRYSVAYKPMVDPDLLAEELDVMTINKRSSMLEMVIRGEQAEIEKVLEKYNPVLIDKAEITLEDVFISEMEATGYDKSQIAF